VIKGEIIKVVLPDGQKRYDFQFVNTRGFKTTVEGLSYKFDREFWNYAKLISGVLRYGMPIDQVVHMISGLEMDNDSINNWTTGVARVLKRYIPGEIVEECTV
jgi:ribonucleoside-diphosphate reductase alpha chain